MNQKYIITIGYQKLVFENAETAMRVYALLTESTPITSASSYPNSPPVDASKVALHMTAEEYREKCKPRPTEIDVEARLVEETVTLSIGGPTDEVPF